MFTCRKEYAKPSSSNWRLGKNGAFAEWHVMRVTEDQSIDVQGNAAPYLQLACDTSLYKASW